MESAQELFNRGNLFYFFKTNFIDDGIMRELIYMFAYMMAMITLMLTCDFFHIGCQMGIVDTVIKKNNFRRQK